MAADRAVQTWSTIIGLAALLISAAATMGVGLWRIQESADRLEAIDDRQRELQRQVDRIEAKMGLAR